MPEKFSYVARFGSVVDARLTILASDLKISKAKVIERALSLLVAAVAADKVLLVKGDQYREVILK